MTSNLLSGEWTVHEIGRVLSAHPRGPLLPPLDSTAWRRVSNNPIVKAWIKPLRAMAQEEYAAPLPELTDELYGSFHRTGIRIPFEKVYFERRRRLARAAMSLLLSEEGDPWRQRFTESLIAKVTDVFEEVSWALPAHVNWGTDDPSGKDPLQIDLFCAETANLMAETLDLFERIIPRPLRERMRARLHHDIFENYLARPFHWKEVTHNWNAVCHQGVIGSALSQVDDVALLSEMLFLARRYLPLFLGGFGKDGGCSEGPGYWSYGFGWFTFLNEQLELRTAGELSLFDGDSHVREIALFGPRMSLAGGNIANFSDNGPSGGLPPAVLSYLGERLNLPECSSASRENYRRLAESGIDASAERCDLFFLTHLFLRCPEELPEKESRASDDSFLPELAVLVAHGTDHRGHQWDFAAKAGHNDEHHNHNDCGSFIVNINGTRFITEIGAPEYVKGFFGPERYEFLAARTLGHSLPIINGCEQAAGISYASRVVSHRMDRNGVTFVMDATRCYPSEAGCREFLRTFEFDKSEGRLTVMDTFALDRIEALEGAIISIHPILLVDGHALILAGNLAMALRPLEGTRFNRVDTLGYQSRSGTEAFIQRLVIEPSSLTSIVRMGVEMDLLPAPESDSRSQ
jgi:hypothetical protein